MKLSEIKDHLQNMTKVSFMLPDGKKVPAHFHVTEIGKIQKDFIDCGGTVRHENVVNFQLWSSIDLHHRLGAEKLLNIIELSETKLGIVDSEIEVEYQGETIGKYGLEINDGVFHLVSKQTDCLAKDNCGIPKIKILETITSGNDSGCCTPGSGCC